MAADERCPAALEERPSRPQHDRRRQGELDPDGDLRRHQIVQARGAGMWPPISRTNTGRVSTRPIQNRRVMSASSWFGAASAVISDRFERHAADRAASRPDLADFRVHRAGVDGVGRRGRGSRRLGLRGICPGRPRTWSGSRPSRNGRLCPHGRKRCLDVAGSTFIPQTGSVTVVAVTASAALLPRPQQLAAAAVVTVLMLVHDNSPGRDGSPARWETWGFPLW